MTKGYMLRLSEQEFNLIGAALAELPFKISAALIQNIQGQARMQRDAEAVEIKTDKSPE